MPRPRKKDGLRVLVDGQRLRLFHRSGHFLFRMAKGYAVPTDWRRGGPLCALARKGLAQRSPAHEAVTGRPTYVCTELGQRVGMLFQARLRQVRRQRLRREAAAAAAKESPAP
jgi:hypothetical protein